MGVILRLFQIEGDHTQELVVVHFGEGFFGIRFKFWPRFSFCYAVGDLFLKKKRADGL